MERLLARERRAQIETPVVMIFAVVAGVLVLLVVGWFLLKQQSGATNERSLTHLKGVTTAIEVAGSTLNAEQNITLIDELRFECEDSQLQAWYGKSDTREVSGVIVFGQSSIRGVATLRSASIGSAFRIGNAVYVTAPRGELTSIINRSSTEELGAGTVRINDDEYPYFSPALLQGARVSGSAELYACGLTQTLKHYRFVNRVQWERTRALMEEYLDAGSTCAYLYDETPFTDIESALSANGKTKEASQDASPAQFTLIDAEAIVGAERQIEQMNSNLIRASCVTVS